jgi:Fe-S-cluster-containing dehydrogenase component
MTYVITRLCRDCKDLGCVAACPTSCILEHHPPGGVSDLPNQLFIDPNDCIDCNQCVAECPWDAIYADADVPLELVPDIALNDVVRTRRSEFRQPEAVRHDRPAPDAIQANKQRWGVGPL